MEPKERKKAPIGSSRNALSSHKSNAHVQLIKERTILTYTTTSPHIVEREGKTEIRTLSSIYI